MNWSGYPYPVLLNGSANGTSSLTALFQLSNNFTNGFLGIMILIIVWFVFFMAVNDFMAKKAMVASIFTLVASVILYIVGLVQPWVVLFSTILVIGSFFWLSRQ